MKEAIVKSEKGIYTAIHMDVYSPEGDIIHTSNVLFPTKYTFTSDEAAQEHIKEVRHMMLWIWTQPEIFEELYDYLCSIFEDPPEQSDQVAE